MLKYGYLSLIIFCVFLAAASSFIIINSKITSDFAKECNSKTGMAFQIDQIYAEASKVMCTEACPCKVADTKLFNSTNDKFNVTALSFSNSGISSYLDCSKQTLTESHALKYVTFLRAMEIEYGCAGICTLPDFFIFSDVGMGTPKGVCKDSAVSAVHKGIWTYANLCFGAVGVGLIGIIMSLAVCLFNKTKPQYTWEKYKSLTS